ncbi:protein phosphatase 2C domain-containing protein [Actinomycetaceae bacterium MB13-C1-2]|nr:protein phosphatase 2C domain-containing protein [Actinomycetaceae bacterium MB13-C1-2]
MAVEFHFAIRSDVGLIRKNNQDSGYAGSRLLAVADGMGGAAGGDVASSVVVAHLAPLDDAPGPSDQLLTNLSDALQDAHDELIERTEENERLRGLGTTCTAILRSENKLAMVHIGDSRAYLLREENLVQVTSDQSLVQYLIDTGQITPKQAETHPKRNVVMNVLGDTPGPVVSDATVREAVVGDRWLLCSDGLSGVVSDETIANTLTAIDDLDECADELVTYALRAGGPDNITVVLADVVEVGSKASQVPEIVGAAAVTRDAPTKGTDGAAGRAAALVNSSVQDGEDEPEERPRGRRRFAWVLVLLVVLAALAGGTYEVNRWVNGQYYVQATDQQIVIYQGIPQTLGPLEISRPIEVSPIRLDSLPAIDQKRLQDPVVRSSREEIDDYLLELSGRAVQNATSESARSTMLSDPSQSGIDSGAD